MKQSWRHHTSNSGPENTKTKRGIKRNRWQEIFKLKAEINKIKTNKNYKD